MRINICGFMVIASLALFLSAPSVDAARVGVEPQNGTVTVGSSFEVRVRLQGDAESLNAVEARIVYQPELLTVTDVTTDQSFVRLWVVEPEFRQVPGVVTLAGGIPNGSVINDGIIVSITFTAKQEGTALVTLDSANTAALLNDGFGTPSQLDIEPGTYTITPAAGNAVDISSPTHPDEHRWYARSEFSASWEPRPNALYSHTLADSPTAQPDTFVDLPAGAATYANLADGVHYFVLSEKEADAQWNIVGNRQVRVDTTPPQSVEAVVTQQPDMFGGEYFLAFMSYDATSGIARYEIEEGGETILDAQNPYRLRDQSLRHKIVVRAYDQAGNIREKVVLRDEGVRASVLRIDPAFWVVVAVVLGIVLVAVTIRVIRRKARHG